MRSGGGVVGFLPLFIQRGATFATLAFKKPVATTSNNNHLTKYIFGIPSASATKPNSLSPSVSKMTVTKMMTASTSSCSSSGSSSNSNPLLESWSNEPFHLPPFAKIEPEHFPSAFEEAMKDHLSDLQAIVDNPAPPTFQNVFVPYDTSGSTLGKVSSVFGNMCSSLNTKPLQKIQMEMSPILSRHRNKAYALPGLFEKVQSVHDSRSSLDLTPEQNRLVERVYMDFTRAGANFSAEDKEEYAKLSATLAQLQTQFQQNVMKDEEVYELVLTKDGMDGCPNELVDAARQAAKERNKSDDEYVITLSRSLVEPFLTYSTRRDLREEAWRAWTSRGELSPERDNLKIATEMLRLRTRQAKMHGCKSFAEYQCQDRMAKTPENVMTLLENVWSRAVESSNRERLALEDFVKENGEDLEGGIQPWDWRYYAEKVRQAKYDFNESVLKPYLSVERVTEAVMAVSNKLFGLRYVKRTDIPMYHPDVDVYEVRETLQDGTDKLTAIFIHDNYARQYKSSGAWMSAYRTQTKNLPHGAHEIESIPIISNNNNFAKGSPHTLLSFDDAITLFHEMGHGHHGILSNATYSSLASTKVLRDWVELPSQLMEHWLKEPEILQQYATHCETGEPVPDQLLQQLYAAQSFNQGFDTVEYTACALLDMALHQMEEIGDDFDLAAFEEKELNRLGMPQGIVMRHRLAHFQHLFSSSSYAAGYYVYLWAEVLDADAFAAFKETGNAFDPETAAKAREFIYSSGNTFAPDELFRKFRGNDPNINFMLKKKGLVQ